MQNKPCPQRAPLKHAAANATAMTQAGGPCRAEQLEFGFLQALTQPAAPRLDGQTRPRTGDRI